MAPKVNPASPCRLRPLLLAAALLLATCLAPAAAVDPASRIASLIDPAKLATLGERGANPRVQKAVYWLATAQAAGHEPSRLLDRALALSAYSPAAAQLTKTALLRNLDIAEKLGCLNEAGLTEMRRGNAPTVMRGPYKGDQLSVDHIIPRAVVPELDNVIANLELLPMRMNAKKNASVGPRQRELATRLFQAGLLGQTSMKALMAYR